MYAGRLSNTTMNSVDDMGSNLRFCFSFFVSVPFIIFALLFSLPPSRNSDPGSHSRLFSPLTHYGPCLAFFFREMSALSSLFDSDRIAPTHAI